MTASAPAVGDRASETHGLGQLVGEDQRVEGDVAADVAAVQIVEDLGQLFQREIGGAMAGVEVRQAEIDRVGPVGDRGAQRLPVAGGGQQLGTMGA